MNEPIAEQLRTLATDLAGAGWRTRFPFEWTPEETAAYQRAPQDEQWTYVQEMFDWPISIEVPEVLEWTP